MWETVETKAREVRMVETKRKKKNMRRKIKRDRERERKSKEKEEDKEKWYNKYKESSKRMGNMEQKYYKLKILEWIKNKNLILRLTQENLIENSV